MVPEFRAANLMFPCKMNSEGSWCLPMTSPAAIAAGGSFTCQTISAGATIGQCLSRLCGGNIIALIKELCRNWEVLMSLS